MTKEAFGILYWFVFISVAFHAVEMHINKTTHSNLNAMLSSANLTQDGTRSSWSTLRNSRTRCLDTAKYSQHTDRKDKALLYNWL